MKNYKFIIIIFLTLKNYSQCWEKINTSSTNPNDISIYDPNASITNPNSKTSPLNWDWTLDIPIPIYTIPNLTTPNAYFYNPIFCHGNSQTSGGCNNNNTVLFNGINQDSNVNSDPLKLKKALDILPEDGWELIKYSFGEPISTKNQLGVAQDRPWFILYNRYTGLLRIFFAMTASTSNIPANKALIEVYLQGKQRGILANAVPITQILESSVKNLKFSVPNDITSLNMQVSGGSSVLQYYWLLAEIPISYDPCTCMSSNDFTGSKSKLSFDIFSIQTSDLKASIRGNNTQVQTPTPIFTGDQYTYNNSTKSDIAFFVDIANGWKSSIFEKYDSFKTVSENIKTGIDGYLQFQNSWNEKLNYKIKRSWFKQQFGSLDGVSDTTLDIVFNEYLTNNDPKNLLLGIENKKNNLEPIKNIVSLIPYVGAAIGFFDFLSQGGDENTNPLETSIPAPPSVYRTDLQVEGQITTKIKESGGSVYLPGAYKNADFRLSNYTNVADFPIYNNSLGVFNIINKPKFEHYNLTLTPSFPWLQSNAVNNCIINNTPKDYQNSNFVPVQYHLKDINYAVNPASNLEIVSIDAAFVFEYDKDTKFNISDLTQLNNQKQIPYYLGMNNKNLTPKEIMDLYDNNGYTLESISNSYPFADDSFIRLRTNYVPFEIFKNRNFILYGNNQPEFIPKTYLKMYIKLKRKDNPLANLVTLIRTFDVTENIIESTKLGDFQSGIINMHSDNVQRVPTCVQSVPDGTCGYYDNQPCVVSYTVNYDTVSIDELKVSTVPFKNIYVSGNGNDTFVNENALLGNFSYNGNVRLKNCAISRPSKLQTTKNIYFGENILDIALVINGSTEDFIAQAQNKIVFEKDVTINRKAVFIAGDEISIIGNNVEIKNSDLIISPNINDYLIDGDINKKDIKEFQASNQQILDVCNSYAMKKMSLSETNNLKEDTKISKSINKLKVSLSPNPNNGQFKLDFGNIIQKNTSVSIYDILGTVVYQNTFKEVSSTEINLYNAPSGIYIIKIDDGENTQNLKFVKE